jgi:hypothetical protein
MRWLLYILGLAVAGVIVFVLFHFGKTAVTGDKVLYRGWYIGTNKFGQYFSYNTAFAGRVVPDPASLESSDKTAIDFNLAYGGDPAVHGYIKAA